MLELYKRIRERRQQLDMTQAELAAKTWYYVKFRTQFKSAFPAHTVHDTRHTFVSLCADAGVDKRIIMAIVGHKGSGITETVYTHLDRDLLLKTANRICY